MVRRIRITLRLQAQRIELAMHAAIFADHPAIEEIAGIELHAGLIGPQFHGAARHRLFDARRQPRFAHNAAAQAEIMIIALADPKLLVGIADPRADAMRSRGNRTALRRPGRLAQRNAVRPYRQIIIRRDRETMIENVATGLDAARD